MRRTTTIATLAAMCAALAVAAPPATGKTLKFDGPVKLAHIPDPTGFPRDVPRIELKVAFAGKTPKVIPGGTVETAGLYGPCLPNSGCIIFCLDTGVCDNNPQCFANTGGSLLGDSSSAEDIKVKKNGRFSGSVRAAVTTSAASRVPAMDTAIITGRITKRSVTGTIRVRADREAIPEANPPRPAMTCDTGVLSFTAPRATGRISPFG